MEAIATLQLIQITSDGARKPLEVQIGKPRSGERGSWVCPVIFSQISDQPREMHGENAMQALCLGLRFVRSMLQSVLDRGGRLVHVDEGADFQLEMYFGQL